MTSKVNKGNLKATPVDKIGSSPAPNEWYDIPAIKEARPKNKGFVEVSLQRLDYPQNINLAQWMGAKNGFWWPASEVFYITKTR